MLKTEYKNIQIKGVATALPENKIMVKEYESVFGEETVTKFQEMTGVFSFYRSNPDQTASDLAFIAAKNLIESKKIDVEDIGVCIVVTQKPDYRVPGTSYLLHKRLQLKEDCICLDINLACSGFIFGLNTASALLQSTSKKYALIMTGDTSNRTMSPEDRTMIMLFGDNGTATILERNEKEGGETSFGLRTLGNKFKSIITPAGAYRNMGLPPERTVWSDGISRSDYDTHMKGMDVFGFSITDVPTLIKDFFQDKKISQEAFDFFALHQPNLYMLKQIARKIKSPMDKILISLDRYGNNSSSSIPLVLCDHLPKMEERTIKILMCGFGGGLSYGCCDISIQTKVVLPIIHSNESFKD
jgi:3-oxoacyl-[acyl-carrier-protein] synthase III